MFHYINTGYNVDYIVCCTCEGGPHSYFHFSVQRQCSFVLLTFPQMNLQFTCNLNLFKATQMIDNIIRRANMESGHDTYLILACRAGPHTAPTGR